MISFWLFLAGITGGFIAGLLGVGGGIIFLAVLPFALIEFGVSESSLVQLIVANSLFGVFFASLAGNIAHFTSKLFYPKESLLVGIAGSISATLILTFIVIQPWYSRWVFNLVIILFLIYVLIMQFKKGRNSGNQKNINRVSSMRLMTSGIAGGTLSAASGAGGGAVTVPLLNHWLGINIKKAKSISLFMILISSLLMTIANLTVSGTEKYTEWQQGLILFPIAIPLTIGVVIGAPLGVKASHMMSSRTLSIIFVFLLIIVIIEKLVELYQLYI